MIPALLAIFGMAALAGLLDLLHTDTDDENHANDTADPPEPDPLPGKDYGVDIELQGESITLDNFNPKNDRLILTTRSLDLDFSFDNNNETLSVYYGDSSTNISAPWGPMGLGASVVVRHVSEIDGDSVATDYVLEILGAISSRDVPAYFQMDGIIGQAGFHGVGSVVNLGDQG